MRVSALLATTLVVLTIREEAPLAFSYFVPWLSSSSARRSSNTIYDPITERRLSNTRMSSGLQDENSYFAGDEDNILKVYEEWRNEYAKGDFDNARYQNFKANYIKLMRANAAELTVARDMGDPDPVPLSLNEYGDLTPEEFNILQTSKNIPQSNNGYIDLQSTRPNAYNVPGDQDRIRQIYKEWCSSNQKVYDESRLQIFATNLQVVENYHRETGKKAELNQYADLSPEEYNVIATSNEETTSQSQQNPHLENMYTYRQTPPSTLHQYVDQTEVERIRKAYLDWCSFHGKEFVESRLDIFATNLLAVESYRVETGKDASLNSFADLSPEEYISTMPSGNQVPLNGMDSYSSNYETLDYTFYNQDTSIANSAANNKGSSYLESLSAGPLTTIDERIQSIYQNWCDYYEKLPSNDGLQYFAKNYFALEKEYIETGKEFTMNEYADLPGDKVPQTLIKEKEEEERSKEENSRLKKESEERLKQARQNEEKRKRAEESLRLEEERKSREREVRRRREEEERAKFEEASKRVEEAQLLEQKQAAASVQVALEKRKTEFKKSLNQENVDSDFNPRLADLDSEKNRLRQERLKVEQALESNRVRLNEDKRREEDARAALEETDRQIDEIVKENEEDRSEEPDSLFAPRVSYLDAVAKTWVERTAYLEALQEGRAGTVLPSYSSSAKKPSTAVEKENLTKIKESESLVNSIWNFMKENRVDKRKGTEDYSRNLIQQADQLIADATNKSNGVVGEELRFLRKAVDAMRRRNSDDVAAGQARAEAKEWEQIQKGLEKEAKLAKKRREHDERIANEARQKARSLKYERRQHERRAEEARRREKSLRDENKETLSQIRSLQTATDEDSTNQGDSFSFFTNPFGGMQKNRGEQSSFDFFSFFDKSETDVDRNTPVSTSVTQPLKIEKKQNWLDAVFDLIPGINTEDEIPGQGTITLEPAKRTSVFDLFVSPDSIAPAKEPGRGSITIEDSQEPSFFSFFAKFGISKEKEKTIDPVRLKRVQDYESKLRTRQEKLSVLKAGRSRILKEKDKKMSRREARNLQRELDSLAADNFPGRTRASDIPQVVKWTRTPDGRITGWISDAAGGRYKMGTKITTSPIKERVVKPGMTITTISGSKYRLGLSSPKASSDSAVANSQQVEANRATNQPWPMGSLFGRLFSEQNVPTLAEWTQNEDGTITGFVNNKEGFEDGTQITTSPVEMGATRGKVIETMGGSKYKLLRERGR